MSGPGLAPDGDFTRDALLEKAGKLTALGQTCRRGGLRLAYHNHNPEFARNNAEMNGLADATEPESLQFLMDAGHARLGGGGEGRGRENENQPDGGGRKTASHG